MSSKLFASIRVEGGSAPSMGSSLDSLVAALSSAGYRVTEVSNVYFSTHLDECAAQLGQQICAQQVSVADQSVQVTSVEKPKRAKKEAAETPVEKPAEPSPAPKEVTAPIPESVSPAAPESSDLFEAARAAAKSKISVSGANRDAIRALIAAEGVDAIGKIPADKIAAFTTAVEEL